MKIGILGGSFDPIHIGHIMLAEYAKTAYKLDYIKFIPDNKSAYGKKYKYSLYKRRSYIYYSIGNNNAFSIDIRSLQNNKLTRTYNIILALLKEFPNDKIYFIVGHDGKDKIKSWYRYKELIKLPRFKLIMASENPVTKCEFYMPNLNIHSSLIKKLKDKKLPYKYLLPFQIREMI